MNEEAFEIMNIGDMLDYLSRFGIQMEITIALLVISRLFFIYIYVCTLPLSPSAREVHCTEFCVFKIVLSQRGELPRKRAA